MKNFCISHAKDVDGIGAAALVLAARGGGFLLTSYGSILDNLDRVPPGIDEFVLCDIGTDRTRANDFVRKMSDLAKRCQVTYIDHHYMDETTERRLRQARVRVVHDVEECASMLTYLTFKRELPEEAKMIALYGAVTDYMDTSPHAKELMEKSERHFVLLEATLLSSSVARGGDDDEHVKMLVRELAKMKEPHKIDDVVPRAVEQLNETVLLAKTVRSVGKRLKRLAYAETSEKATGNVAKLLIGAFNTPVGVAFKEDGQRGWYEASFRGTSKCRVHLGQVVGRMAESYGGTGGGHKLSAGCRIPKGKMLQLLRDLDKKI